MIEFKTSVMLTEKEYEHLKKTFFASATKSHEIDYYYDNINKDMHRNNITCRINENNGVFSIFVKDRSYKDNECNIENCYGFSNEYNDLLFKKAGLECIGRVYTEQSSIYEDKFKIIMNKNIYLETLDYELEIEYPSALKCSADDKLLKLANLLKRGHIIDDVMNFISRQNSFSSRLTRLFKVLTDY